MQAGRLSKKIIMRFYKLLKIKIFKDKTFRRTNKFGAKGEQFCANGRIAQIVRKIKNILLSPIKLKCPGFLKSKIFWIIILIIFISSFFGFLAGITAVNYFYFKTENFLSKLNIELLKPKIIKKELQEIYLPQVSQEEAIIKAVEKVSPAVVSIIITKDLPIIEKYYISPFEDFPFGFKIPKYRQKGTKKKEVGGGSGFIVSKDGIILTNKHVVLDESAEYTVLTNDGRKFPAKVLAKDNFQDLAILKIEQEKVIDKNGEVFIKSFPVAKLGDSSNLKIGQTVIAIGNALGEFRNTVSVGVISGLGRTITASGEGLIETIEDVIQTDAAINKGNSGGPLLNLKGEVVGINTATVLGAQNIGFAIPVNKAKRDIKQIKVLGKIVYPFLGIHYLKITEEIAEERNLPKNYGAWITRWYKQNNQWLRSKKSAIVPNTAAEKYGLKEEDIILEFGGEKITLQNTLAKIIQRYEPGDRVVLKILRPTNNVWKAGDKGKQKYIEVQLGERPE